MTIKRVLGTVAAIAITAATFGTPAEAEDRISAVAAFGKQVGFTQSFLRFVDKANAAAKGTFQINFVGGPEAMPTFEQAEALRKGVMDMNFTPSSYYAGNMPEIDALVGGNVAPWEARANGGLDMLNKIQQQKMNAYMLGWVEYGARFNFYLKTAPKLRPDGLPDLTAVKMRGAPAYRELLTMLGANFVNIAGPEVYTALERGTVDGLAWPAVGIMDFGWERFVKHKVTPEFFNLDIVINVNVDKWKALTPQSRDLLTKLVIEWERESYNFWIKQAKQESEELAKRGVQDFALSPDASRRFQSLASETVWDRMKSRAPESAAALRPKFYKE